MTTKLMKCVEHAYERGFIAGGLAKEKRILQMIDNIFEGMDENWITKETLKAKINSDDSPNSNFVEVAENQTGVGESARVANSKLPPSQEDKTEDTAHKKENK